MFISLILLEFYFVNYVFSSKKDYKKTDMKAYVEIFDRFLSKLEKTWKGKNLIESGIQFFKQF